MNDFVELRKIFSVARRWWWVLLSAVLIGALAGFLFSSLQTPIYRATTTLLVGKSIHSTTLDNRELAASEQLAQTYANIVRLQPVMSAVTENLKLNVDWRILAKQVTASRVENTQLLKISFETTSPEVASAVADEIANTLIRLSPTTLQSQVQNENQKFAEQRLERLRANISDGQKRIDELEILIPQAENTEALQKIQNEIDSLQNLVTGWENNYSRLLDFIKQSESPNFLTVVEPAQVGSAPIRPLTQVNMLVVALAALALTFGAVVLFEFTKDSPESVEELLQELHVASLGSVGTLKGNALKERLIINHNLFSPVSEDYRLLRSKIQFGISSWHRKIVIITSAVSGEMSSIVTANLGIVMAQAGLKTVIIDANLRNPLQHELFDLSNSQGLAEMLYASDADYKIYLQGTPVHNLKVLSAGAIPTLYPSEVLSSMRMQKLLVELSAQTDIILCDTPEVVRFADTMVLSKHVDGVILVVDANKPTPTLLEQAVTDLKQADARLIGAVIGTNVISGRNSSFQQSSRFNPSMKGTTSGKHVNDKESQSAIPV